MKSFASELMKKIVHITLDHGEELVGILDATLNVEGYTLNGDQIAWYVSSNEGIKTYFNPDKVITIRELTQ